MRSATVQRLRHGAQMVPARARIAVRRLRRYRRTQPDAVTTWRLDTPHGLLTATPPQTPVLLDDAPVGTLTCRVDSGTSTAECGSTVPDELAAPLVELVVAGIGRSARRVAWFVAVDDTALETAVSDAGFACEGWAAPPVGDRRPHQQWALLT